jgi:hypothetical protein
VAGGLEAAACCCEELVGLACAESTQCCYECWWLEFVGFADKVGRVALLASEEMVGCFFAQLDLDDRGGGV